jgi:hypothetical protein
MWSTLSLDNSTWLSWLWLGVLLLPLVPLALRRRRPNGLPVARRTGPSVGRRTLFRWPTRFPVVLLAGAGPQEPLPRLQGTVVDINGGGLRVRVQEALAPGTRLRIDPQFSGPFPLAGLHCRVVSSHQEGDQAYLQLSFVHLPAETEGRTVRRIYQHQLGIGLANPMDPDGLRLRRRRGLHHYGPTQSQ